MKYLLIALLLFTGTPAIAQRRIPPPETKNQDIKDAYKRYVFAHRQQYNLECSALMSRVPTQDRLRVMTQDCQPLYNEIMSEIMPYKQFECMMKAIKEATKCPFDDDNKD